MMIQLRDIYSLKYNPFTPDVPLDALLVTPRIADFQWRIEHGLCVEGGFAMVTGAPGLGKSVTGRLLARHLEGLRDVMVAPLQKPQSNVADFYRELGEDAAAAEPSPRPRRLGWAHLLARVFAIDITVCRKCGGRMRVVDVVTDPDDIARILHGARAPPKPPRPHPPGQVLLFAC